MRYLAFCLTAFLGLLISIGSCSFVNKGGDGLNEGSESGEKAVGKYQAGSLSFEDPQKTVDLVVPDTFVLPQIPETITEPTERAIYLMMHYWDRFDFANRRLIDRPEITEQAFVDYINILSHIPKGKADESLVYTLEKASVDSMMYGHFATMFEKYLYDPNSPFRNEEMYIPVLDEVVGSSLITKERRSNLLFQQEMVLKNQVGKRAANFVYTLPSGRSQNLYDLESEYILLVFYNPECHSCEAVIRRLEQSKGLNRAFSMNSHERTMLTVLAVYPDKELDEWISYLDNMPTAWIHGYDKGMEITMNKIYDLKAIPTLYLLDREKKVLFKDVGVEVIDAFFSN